MKKSILFISFEEAQHICVKAQYEESTFWEKVKLNFRYLWCRATRKYVSKNHKLTQAISESNIACLNPKEIQYIKQNFDTHLKHQDEN